VGMGSTHNEGYRDEYKKGAKNAPMGARIHGTRFKLTRMKRGGEREKTTRGRT